MKEECRMPTSPSCRHFREGFRSLICSPLQQVFRSIQPLQEQQEDSSSNNKTNNR